MTSAAAAKYSGDAPEQGPPQRAPGGRPVRPGGPPEPARRGRWLWTLLIVAGIWFLLDWSTRSGEGREILYSEFKQHLAAGEVVRCRVELDRVIGSIKAKPAAQPATADGDRGSAGAAGEPDRDGSSAKEGAGGTAVDAASGGAAEPWQFHALRVDDPSLTEELERAGVAFTGAPAPGFGGLWTWLLLLLLFLPMLLLPLLRRSGAAMGRSAFGFGRSRARMFADRDTGVTFADVAGCEEAKTDLREIVAFLRHPAKFSRLGARVPKGVLLLGPPGTGKTLLARAVAGEAHVPFFSINGSEFVEMFVGVGAARVRDLFEQAKRTAPCIVFMDEIDAIGRARGGHIGMVNDEREQTLNQLLVELDGFEPNSGVMILAATNRPEVLDRALLRPGRFDRQVVLDAPDRQGRLAILRVHARGKPLADDVDLESIARATPGLSGADLENVLNEAALLASRRDGEQIAQQDLEEAVERIVTGPERQSRRMREVERRRVAFHECGHALVAHFSRHGDPVHKISIVPRGRAALGYTMQRPVEEQMLLTRAELEDRLAMLLGGRSAEELVFGDVSTGAADDLDRATSIARQMATMFGMGEAAGLMRCVHDPESPFLRPDGRLQRDCSEATADLIDAEVKQVLAAAHDRARAVLERHRQQLDRLAEALLQRERLERADVEAMLGPRPAGAQVPPGSPRVDG